MSILEVHNVSIRYLTGDFKDIGLKEYVMRRLTRNYHVNEFWADRNISFSLEKGEMLGIIGTNGAGKSTLLKAVSGIMEPTEGFVKRHGSLAALLELVSGFDRELTVKENAYLRGAMLGYTRKFMDEAYDQIIEFAELQDFQDRPFKQLSSGMKSRLAFSIASMVQPDILILDEVLSVGDGAFRKKSEEKMREIISSGAATILVSHSLEQIQNLCTKVLWLEKGRQIALGDTEIICDLYQQYLDRTLSLKQIKKELLKTGNCRQESEDGVPQKCVEKRAQVQAVEHQESKKALSSEEPKRKGKNFFAGKINVNKPLIAYSLLFFVTFFMAYSPFLLDGKSFIWIGSTSDGRIQHYPTLIYIGRYLRQIVLNLFHGELSIPLFDLNLAMGGDIIATLNYYGFGNPLYLLSAFVPTHYTEYLYNVLIVVRLYLAGLSFLALCRYHKKEFSHALIGALIYVFSGYAIFAAIRHPYFVEPMIQLPLLLIGIDLVIKKRKPFIFIFSVFYSALCGFYFLYMMTIMLGVYTLVCFFDYYKESRAKEFISMAGRIIMTYLLGIGLGAVLFVPNVISFLTSGRSEGATKQIDSLYKLSFYRDALTKLIAPPGTWTVFSLGAIVLLALVLLLTRKKQYRGLKLLLLAAMVTYVLPVGSYIMNGFSYPSRRWTFGVALLLSYILVEMLPILLELDKKQQLLCCGTLLLYGVMIFFDPKNRNVYSVVGVAMLAITLLTLCLLSEKSREGKNGRRIGALACTLLVIGNVSINAIYCFAKDQNNYVGAFPVKGAETKSLETAIEREAEPYLAEEAGRFDSSSFSRNMGAIWRVPTISTYWSMLNGAICDLWGKTENIDQQDTSFKIDGTDERTYINALLSMKYFIEEKSRTQYVPYGYSLREETNEKLIYENEHALPWGYTYDSYIPADSVSTMNGLEIAEAMLQHIVLEENVPVESGKVKSNIQTIPYTIKNQKDVKLEDKVLTVGKNNAAMTLEFQMPKKAEGYLRIQGLNIDKSGQSYLLLTVNCLDVEKSAEVLSASNDYYYGRTNYLFNLGYSEEERTACTIIFPKKGKYKLEDIQIFALPMDKYPEQVEALREEPLENIEFGTNRITGTVDLSKDKILCLSIPYSKGWSAKVDGQKVKILRGNYMFMALPLTAGYHNIEFTYCTPGLKVGIAYSVFSAAVVILLLRKHKRCSNEDGTENAKYRISRG